MKTTCFVFALVAAAASADPDWESYKKQFHRRYDDPDEESMRHANFNASKIRVQAKNSKLKTPIFGWTKYSDRTDKEFKMLLGRSQKSNVVNAVKMAAEEIEIVQPPVDFVAPRTIDWRTTPGVVSSIKDQGQCGSCWAFSTAETVESQRVLAGFAPIDLSPQQIAAYTPGMYGCGGGDPIPAYDYIMNKKGANNPVQGLATGWYCPYTQSMFAPCNGNTCTNACSGSSQWQGYAEQFPVARLSGYKWATKPCASGGCAKQDLTTLQTTVAQRGPVSICLNAGAWNDYNGGIMTADACGSMAADAVDHCVQLVGFHKAVNASDSYWLVRNSWSTNWGENGYIRLQLDANTCGVANEASVPDILV